MSDTTPEQVTTDVLIVGGGISGAAAAAAATEAGAHVTVLEKRDRVGGSSVLSGGFLAFAGTPIQEELGIHDSGALLYEDLREMGDHLNDDMLVRAYVDGQLELFEWLRDHGVNFWNHVEVNSGQSVPRSHKVDPAQAVDALIQRAQATGRLDLRLNTRAVSLQQGSGGAVTGAIAASGQSEVRITAQGGVVLTTGGFSRSQELLGIFAPAELKSFPFGGLGSTGDGLKMAWRLGAGVRDMGYVKGTLGTHPKTGDDQHEMLFAFYDGAVVVNKSAQRYVDESISYKKLGVATLDQEDATGFLIFDQQIFDKSVPGVRTHDYAEASKRGLLVTSETLEGLAEKLGLDADQLVTTVDRYNEDVRSFGVDKEFGRDGVCNHFGELEPIEVGPFYGYEEIPVMQATYGGVQVDTTGRVIRVSGDLIPGLYAAGEIVGGFHGPAYMTGTSLGKGALFGRIAALDAAARVTVKTPANNMITSSIG